MTAVNDLFSGGCTVPMTVSALVEETACDPKPAIDTLSSVGFQVGALLVEVASLCRGE